MQLVMHSEVPCFQQGVSKVAWCLPSANFDLAGSGTLLLCLFAASSAAACSRRICCVLL